MTQLAQRQIFHLASDNLARVTRNQIYADLQSIDILLHHAAWLDLRAPGANSLPVPYAFEGKKKLFNAAAWLHARVKLALRSDTSLLDDLISFSALHASEHKPEVLL